MDPLTHTLTGLALSRAGLNRLTPHATPILLVAANAPDLDIVTLAASTADYLHFHRHLTHAFIAVPFMALFAVGLVRLFARKPLNWKWAYAVALAGALSHPLLDWLNSYGIRLLLPFSSEWLHLDLVSLPDLWMWVVLIGAAFAPLLSRLVNSEIGARPGSGRGFAVMALCFVVLYPFGRYLLHERAVAVLNSRLYEGAPPTRVMALPGIANPFAWRGVVETGAFYSILDVNLLREFDPAGGRVLYKPELRPREAAAARAARSTKAFRSFLEFSQLPYWRVVPLDHPQDAMRVEASDLRFGAPPQSRFVASAIVDARGRVLEAHFRY
ncbi:MAG TPA: metal-dependent hydrolase [Bryobacteraceae bacterium]|nr:metal-dependent hydrolase [Bryobacteraceae bacterium]